MNYDLLWSKVLEKINEKVTSLVYKTWFKDTFIYKIENNILTIAVPYEMHIKNLSERYLEYIVGALTELTNNVYDIDFILQEKIQEDNKLSTKIVDKSFSQEEPVVYKHSSNLKYILTL